MSTEEGTEFELQWIIGSIAGVGVLAFLLTSPPFFSPQAMLHVSLPTLLWIGVPTALAAAIWWLVYWFKPRGSTAAPHWNLKRDSPGTWTLVGISVASLAALTALFVTYRIGSVAAQFLPGSTRLVPATVTSYQRSGSRRSLCHASAAFSTEWGGEVRACVAPAIFNDLAERDLQIGEAVQLEITTNFAGSALTEVQLTDQNPSTW